MRRMPYATITTLRGAGRWMQQCRSIGWRHSTTRLSNLFHGNSGLIRSQNAAAAPNSGETQQSNHGCNTRLCHSEGGGDGSIISSSSDAAPTLATTSAYSSSSGRPAGRRAAFCITSTSQRRCMGRRFIACRAVPGVGDCGAAVQQIHQAQARAAERLHRFYVPEQVGADAAPTYCIEGEEARHALRSLRLKEGDQVEVCDGLGTTVRCCISSVDTRGWKAWVAPLGPPLSHPWVGPEWVLAVGCLTLKGGRTEWLVEKATELGARELVPLSTDRSQAAPLGSKFKGKGKGEDGGEAYTPGRMERVAIAATKQSLRPHGLTLRQPTTLADLLSEVRGAEVALLAAAGAPPASSVLRQHLRTAAGAAGAAGTVGTAGAADRRPARRLLLVGPEGDFSPAEVETLVAAGAIPVGLGANRLRTETAAIALLSLCMLLEQ